MALRILLFFWLSASRVTPTALAQEANYLSVDAVSAKPAQLSYHASTHNDCTPATTPTIRVIEPPKWVR